MLFKRLSVHTVRSILASGLIAVIALINLGADRISPAYAANFTIVTSLSDSGGSCPDATNCTLRAAIAVATANNLPGMIAFAVSGKIVLGSTLTITNSSANRLTIDGGGQSITVDGGGHVGIFLIPAGSNVVLNKLTLQNGSTVEGGAALNAGTLVISNSTLSGNYAEYHGGAVFNAGTLTISNSTVSKNFARLSGGGVVNVSGPLTISNSTLFGNMSNGMGGGLVNYQGTTNVLSSIVASGIAFSNSDVYGAITSLGHNLIGDNTGASGLINGTSGDQVGSANAPIRPLLGSLAATGHMIQTVALLTGSPALGNGDCGGNVHVVPSAPAVTTDERGTVRNMPCNIGAYEESASDTPVAPPVLLQKTSVPGQPLISGSVPGDNPIGD